MCRQSDIIPYNSCKLCLIGVLLPPVQTVLYADQSTFTNIISNPH